MCVMCMGISVSSQIKNVFIEKGVIEFVLHSEKV